MNFLTSLTKVIRKLSRRKDTIGKVTFHHDDGTSFEVVGENLKIQKYESGSITPGDFPGIIVKDKVVQPTIDDFVDGVDPHLAECQCIDCCVARVKRKRGMK